MNLLLDTHTFLWWDDDKLPRAVVKRIQGAGDVYVSAASAWEMAIKVTLGKLTMKSPLGLALADYGFTPLPISFEHADAVRALPPHHRDPFDRMLVAQARVLGLAIVSRDSALAAYDVPIVWA